MRIIIEREYEANKPTKGWLTAEGTTLNLVTVELPWLNNMRNISCIPEGDYVAMLYNSPRHGRVVLFDNVPDRSYIEIHIANFVRELRGCLAVGITHSDIDGDGLIDVSKSGIAMSQLLNVLHGNITISVRERI